MSKPIIDFIDDRERQLFAETELGEQVRAFLISPAGRYLHGRCKLEVEQAKDELLECNLLSFWGRRKAARLQNKAELARQFMRFLSDAIQNGDVAYKELSNYRGDNT